MNARVIILLWCLCTYSSLAAADECPLLPLCTAVVGLTPEPAAGTITPPTKRQLYCADEKLQAATKAFNDAETALETARKAQQAALEQINTDSASANGQGTSRQSKVQTLTTHTSETSEAIRQWNAALEERDKAQLIFDCTKDADERARRWVQAIGITGSVAQAVDGTGHTGLALRFMTRYDSIRSWEFLLGVHDLRLRGADPELTTLTTASSRIHFGTGHAQLVLGIGAGALGDGVDPGSGHYVVLGEIGAAVRFGNRCDPSNCEVLAADPRVFIQPWIPLDGSRFAILFGVEVGALVGYRSAFSEGKAPSEPPAK